MVKKMENISINKLKNFIGKEVQLNGWIYNLRSVGKIWFAIVRDGTGFVQCVVTSNDVSKDVFGLESTLTQESSVIVKGAVESLIVALVALDKVIVAVSLFSSRESAKTGTLNVPEELPAAIVSVPDVAV